MPGPAPRGRGLHLHLPWPDDAPPDRREKDAYARAVGAELALAPRRSLASSSLVVAWSVGGGDALAFGPGELDDLLEGVGRAFRFHRGAERTVECGARSVTAEKAAVLARHRVTRISLRGGVEPEEIARAAGSARAAGIGRIAVDLFLDDDRFAECLGGAIRAGAEHVSLGEGTESLGADEWSGRHRSAAERLAASGLVRYEGFHFARPGAASVAIRLVSSGGDVIGVGPGAAGIVGRRRYRNESSLGRYADVVGRGAEPVEFDEVVGPNEHARERILLAIGRVSGMDPAREGARTGVDLPGRLAPVLGPLVAAGLARTRRRRILLTDRGRENFDDVARALTRPLGGSLDKGAGGQ